MNKRYLAAVAFSLLTGATGIARAQQPSPPPAGMPWYYSQTVPTKAQASFWEAFKAILGPNTVIPAKYNALISLAVSAQIPCEYCIYATTKLAERAGASPEEIREAVAIAGMTRLVSTIENGNMVDFKKFKATWDASK